MTSYKILFYLFSLALLSSCSGTYKRHYQTLKVAFQTQSDVNLSYDYVRDSSTDLLEIKRGDRTKIVMALGYIKSGQSTWVSNDKLLLTIEQGRIVKTTGFLNDLLYLSNTKSDPLKFITKNIDVVKGKNDWMRINDWENGEYGHQVISSFSNGGQATLKILSKDIHTKILVEGVSYQEPKYFIQLNNKWTNYYWFDVHTGKLIKSRQLLHPLDEPLEMTYLSRVVRIVSAKNNVE